MRRESKPEIEVPRRASFCLKDGDPATAWIVRLSMVGLELESLQPPHAGAEIVVRAELVDGEGELSLPGRVQWATPVRFGVQFGPLGVRETRAIVRVSRRPAA
jgi:Tfp pilus assembly protein PilZ